MIDEEEMIDTYLWDSTIKELVNIIKNMTDYIHDLDTDEDICKKVEDCRLKQSCKLCIVKFFGRVDNIK